MFLNIWHQWVFCRDFKNLLFNMRRYTLNFNYLIANFVSLLKIGLLRRLRFIRIPKTAVYIRLLSVLYKHGLLRTFRVEFGYIVVYFKFKNGQPIGKLTLISRPGKRARWTLGYLANNYNKNNFSGFYIISSQKGFITSDYSLLDGHKCGEVLIKVEFN
jgi:ribosomal protein S8